VRAGSARPSAYVFDFDGTLASVPVDWDGVKKDLREVLGSREELPSVFPTIVRLMKDDPSIRDRAFALIDQYEERALPKASLSPGSFDLLELISRTSKISLVTMQGSRAIDSLLSRFELNLFVLHRFTREESTSRAEQVEMALSAMGVKKDDSLFVADRLHDLNVAREIGIPFAMVRTHGSDPVEEDVTVFHSVEELLDAVRARERPNP